MYFFNIRHHVLYPLTNLNLKFNLYVEKQKREISLEGRLDQLELFGGVNRA
jgi:hypothetical protein